MHEHFLQQAINLALENVRSGSGGPYGAIIVKHGNILAASANSVTQDKDPTAHAEIMAIRKACLVLDHFQLNDCILYSSCEPCPMCLGAIYWARLLQVFFASDRHDAARAQFDDQLIYEQLTLPPEHRQIPMQQITMPDAAQPFRLWTEKNTKTRY
ncbi:MAG: nucleoside deaminase [Methylococcaceae bacterium]|jgi:guanine deaminase